MSQYESDYKVCVKCRQVKHRLDFYIINEGLALKREKFIGTIRNQRIQSYCKKCHQVYRCDKVSLNENNT